MFGINLHYQTHGLFQVRYHININMKVMNQVCHQEEIEMFDDSA